MDTATLVSLQVISLFLIMLIGYVGSLFGFITKSAADGMSKLLVYVTNPLLVFTAFNQSAGSSRWGEMLTILGASAVIHLASTVIALFLFRGKPARTANALRFSVIFANCSYMGYPLLEAMFPTNGRFYGACYVLFCTLYMWTAGVFMLSSGKKGSLSSALKNAVLNPGVIAAVLGVLFCILGIRLPGVISGALSSTANITFPIAMLILGNMLKNAPLGRLLSNGGAYFATVVRLAIIPLLVLLFCTVLGLAEGTTYVCVIMAAIPVAAKTPILADNYGADKESALATVAISTLASVVTIPLMLYLTQLVIKL